jgi:hypothetical protein
MPPQLTLAELYSVQKQKQVARHDSYDRVLELCHRRVRTVATYGGMNSFFEIPGMIIGYPLYNIRECMNYVIEAMRKSGFLVQILPPPHFAVMYISWEPSEVRPPVRKHALTGGKAGVAGLLGTARRSDEGILRLF